MSTPPDPSSSPPPPPPPPERRHKGTEKQASKPEGALRRTVVRPAGVIVDPVDGAYVSDRMTTLTHELANLLDGSMRCLTLAMRSVGRQGSANSVSTVGGGDLVRHLDTVQAAMQQMSELVKCAMQGISLAGARGAPDDAGSMAEAVRHAVEVMTPLADERSIRLTGDVAPELTGIMAGAAFTIITNSIKNSIESIERAGRAEGRIEVFAHAEDGPLGRCVVLEVLDDGEGPPKLPSRAGDSPFKLGYSTKQGGSGVGLALCREIVQELGGRIELTRREPDSASGRAGASLRATFPASNGNGSAEEHTRR